MNVAEMIHQLRVDLWNISYTQWKTTVLFSPHWWALVVLIAISYIVWWKLVDKSRLSQMLLFGSFIAAGRIVMDIIGSNTVLWSYDIREVPFTPSPFLHDFTITPLALMLVYQYCHSWKKFLAWTSIATGCITFVFFPLLIVFDYLKYYHWNHIYSFILIILIAALSRAVILGVLQLEQSYNCAHSNDSPGTLISQPAMKPLSKEDDTQND